MKITPEVIFFRQFLFQRYFSKYNSRSMAETHLGHKINWDSLSQTLMVYKNAGIEMPTGQCCKIHVCNRKTQIQYERRKFLKDKVCTDSNCKTTGTKVFYKSEKKQVSSGYRNGAREDDKHLNYFAAKFLETIDEFAQTEFDKYAHIRQQPDFKPLDPFKLLENLKKDNRWYTDSCWMDDHCWCRLVINLIELGDSKLLMSLSDELLSKVLSCLHGGQAVGNNVNFLFYHVFVVYVQTNLILVRGHENNCEYWGPMNDSCYFRKDLMYNCDGQTFLERSRPFLADDVYMKDFNAMRQLLKDCFKFIYFLQMLSMVLGRKHFDLDFLKQELLFQIV